MGCDNTAKIMEAIENFDFAGEHISHERYGCLLYTSDAADE